MNRLPEPYQKAARDFRELRKKYPEYELTKEFGGLEFYLQWQDITGDSIEACRNHMLMLSDEEVAAGYKHYMDQWTWVDASDHNKMMLDAFHQELQAAQTESRTLDLFKKKLDFQSPPGGRNFNYTIDHKFILRK